MRRLSSFIGLFVMGLSIMTVTTLNKSASANSPQRVSSSYMEKVSKKMQYYRLNKNIRPASSNLSKKTAVPKGTILNLDYTIDSGSHQKEGKALISDLVEMSYVFKKKLGFKPAYRSAYLLFSYYPHLFTRVKRPAYVLPYSDNVLYFGGLSALKREADSSFVHPKSTSKALRITSDGYLELYVRGRKPLSDPIFNWQYAQKPTAYVKIAHAINKGSKKYLYYQKKLPEVRATRLYHGKYCYRLRINNLHTPYRYTSNQGANTYASFYSVGGSRYFTVPWGDGGDGD